MGALESHTESIYHAFHYFEANDLRCDPCVDILESHLGPI